MNKEQIEDIIKDLEKREYEVRFKTYEDNIVGFYCNVLVQIMVTKRVCIS